MTEEQKLEREVSRTKKIDKGFELANFFLVCIFGFAFVNLFHIEANKEYLLLTIPGLSVLGLAYLERLVTGGYFKGRIKGFEDGMNAGVVIAESAMRVLEDKGVIVINREKLKKHR